MHKKDLNIVKKFKKLVSKKVKVYEVRVFGSRARGDASEESARYGGQCPPYFSFPIY